MLPSSTTQSMTFTAGGDMSFALPNRINALSLNTMFPDDRARSGETLNVTAQGASLSTLEIEGNGRVEWNNVAPDATPVNYVDATGLAGGLDYTASGAGQETIDLGGEGNGVDVIRMSSDASTYGVNGDRIDTLIGFDSMHDTLIVDDEILVSFENVDFDYAVVAHDAGSLEEALTIAGEQDSGDAIMPVIIGDQTWLYQDSNQQGFDANDFVLALEDLTGGIHILADRQDFISRTAPAPIGPFTDVIVDGTVSGMDNHADSFVFGDDGSWHNGVITNFELGIDRIDVSGLSGSDGQPLDFNDISVQPSGSSSELRINDDSDGFYSPVFLAGVSKYDPGAPLGELTYALRPEDFLFV